MTAEPRMLNDAYAIETPQEAERFYDAWAEGYEAEVGENGYATPERCARALAAHVDDPSAPLMDLGCGTGLSGLALQAAGFSAIDGFDISEKMLEIAEEKGVYLRTEIADLSQPLEGIEDEAYANAAAVGAVNPGHLPVTVLDWILAKLPVGGCFVFSVNDHAMADGQIKGRVNELVDTSTADLLYRDYGEHLPEIGLQSMVYVLKKR